MAQQAQTQSERRDTDRSRLLIGAGASLVAGIGLFPGVAGLSDTAGQLLAICGIGIVLAAVVSVLARRPAISWICAGLGGVALVVLVLEFEATAAVLATLALALVAVVGGFVAARVPRSRVH